MSEDVCGVCVCVGGGYNCTLGSIAVHLNNIYTYLNIQPRDLPLLQFNP